MTSIVFNLLLTAADNTVKNPSSFTKNILMLIMGLTIIMWILMRQMRKKTIFGQQESQLSAKEKLERTRQCQTIYDGVETLMAELADLSRQVNGQLDTRIARMDLLIEEADRKIKQLQDLTSAAPAEHSDDTPIKDIFESSKSTDLDKQMDSFVTEANHEIVALADEGLAPPAIAQKLNRPIGEIELILSLVRKKR